MAGLSGGRAAPPFSISLLRVRFGSELSFGSLDFLALDAGLRYLSFFFRDWTLEQRAPSQSEERKPKGCDQKRLAVTISDVNFFLVQ